MIISSVGSALIGGIAGGVGTYIVQEKIRANKKEEKIRQLRQSLIAELSCLDELANEKSSNYRTQVPGNEIITAEVYKSNSSQISLLTPEEAEAVIRFYTGAILVNQSIQTARDLISQSDNPQLHDYSSINQSLDRIRQDWKSCVLELMSNMEGYPNQIKIEEEEYTLDEDIPTPILWMVLNRDRLGTADITFQN
ncbi:hypothetical protein ACFPM1_10420 [Halorubrum rubrum]|uniref:Uncharacterized protein n=1 Tax=Halorubrum rubrum TaxID=1126240 RepID=A0ABD5R2S3_9EURY|nr:hypothetical protein [Halorubrum rubrum]